MADYKHIAVAESNKTAYITLQRDALNILNIEMMEEINAALESLNEGRDLRALVFNAMGKAFSAGVDISEHTADLVEKMIHTFHQIFRLLDKFQCPTVAMVHGAALGGGCELACFCDMVLASKKAKFGQPEIKVGVFPPVAAAAFPQYGYLKSVYELLLLGETISADEAKEIELVNRVFPKEEFDTGCQEFIKKLTANSGAILRLCKKTIKAGLGQPFTAALDTAEEIYLKEMMSTKDAHEGLDAFLNKREAKWADE